MDTYRIGIGINGAGLASLDDVPARLARYPALRLPRTSQVLEEAA